MMQTVVGFLGSFSSGVAVLPCAVRTDGIITSAVTGAVTGSAITWLSSPVENSFPQWAVVMRDCELQRVATGCVVDGDLSYRIFHSMHALQEWAEKVGEEAFFQMPPCDRIAKLVLSMNKNDPFWTGVEAAIQRDDSAWRTLASDKVIFDMVYRTTLDAHV